jgi:hypothetical protein
LQARFGLIRLRCTLCAKIAETTFEFFIKLDGLENLDVVAGDGNLSPEGWYNLCRG